MATYKTLMAVHKIGRLKAAAKAIPPGFESGGSSGLLIPRNFQKQLEELAKDGWTVVSSNATNYGDDNDGVILYALLRHD